MASSIDSATFKVTSQFDATYCKCSFTEYESQTTGLRVVVVDSRGPKVNGYFALATEIHDDSGAPHTLEHLIFMGSHDYPYKGFLDKLASRAYSYTNAWTGNDQTVYTLETAGWDGFNQMLPVYLDHVIQPTLTDEACYTEVHHIDGEGQDAGVVYSEMQGRQNTQYDLIELEKNRLVYPEHVGFRYETGGLMERLRVLPASRIRAFHREMYQPKNLSVIIIGDVNHQQLLESLERFEKGLRGRVPEFKDNFDRPWVKQGKTPPLTMSATRFVEFPDEDESTGEISVSYLGPDYQDIVGRTAIVVLLTYLAGSPISLLNEVLVEQENLASLVTWDNEVRPDLLMTLMVEGVETENLELVKQKLLALLTDAGNRPFDMKYLHQCLQRTERQARSMAEKEPSNFHPILIERHLFGERGSVFEDLDLKEYTVLAKWSENQWKSFFRQWFLDAHYACVIAKPSSRLGSDLEEAENKRVQSRKQELGEKGLTALRRRLSEARAANDRPIPKELMRQFQPPPSESVHFFQTVTASSGLAQRGGKHTSAAQETLDRDSFDSPLFLHFESVPSSFVRLNVTLCTQQIPEERRPLLQLLLANFFDTPVTRAGKRVEYDRVQAEIEDLTVAFTADLLDDNSELINIRYLFEPSKYEEVIAWAETLLLDRIFDPTRLDAILRKLLADVPEEKRMGAEMAESINQMVLLDHKSTLRAFNTLTKSRYLSGILRLLKREPQKVIDMMTEMMRVLTIPSNIRVSIIAELESSSPLPRPRSSFAKFAERFDLSQNELIEIDDPRAGMSKSGRSPGDLAYLIPMKSLDSSYAVLTAKGVKSFTDPAYPALTVAEAYLDATEGPLWTAIRGSGLAYGAGFQLNESKGLTVFRIFRSPDAVSALRTAKRTIENIVNGQTEIDQFAFEGALSSTIVRIADEQPNMIEAANKAFSYQVIHKIGKQWPEHFLSAVQRVTIEDMRSVMKDTLMRVFDPSSANAVVTCSPALTDKMSKGLVECGFEAVTKPLAFFEDDYGLTDAGDGADDELSAGETDDDDADMDDESDSADGESD